MASNKIGRRLAFVGLTALVGSLMPLSAASAAHLTGVTNLDADDNVGASIAWSETGGFPSGGLASGARDPQYVLIGRDDLFADNLASGALQGADGPLLLTDTDALDQRVADEIARLGVDRAIILGGEAAISADVADELGALVATVDRIEGPTRIETAIEVTRENGTDTAILARAYDADGGDTSAAFADSLAAGAWAAADDTGLLLTQTDVLTTSVADYLAEGDIANVIIVGGEAAVSAEVEAAVADLVDSVTRVAGENRAATAVEIADARGFAAAADAPGVILSEGYTENAWADGFSAAATSALEGYPVVLANGDGLPPETEAFAGAAATASFAQTAPDTNVVCGPFTTDAACDEFVAITGTVDLALDAAAITVGDDITGSISGDVASVTVSGCGIADGTVVDVAEDGTFNLGALTDTPDEADGTTCVLTFIVTDSEGNEITRTATVTITPAPAPETVTDAPELVEVQEVARTATQTALLYVFDEEIAAAVANTPANFQVVDFEGTPTDSVAAPVKSTDNVNGVVAIFPNAAYDAAVAATVVEGAVQDINGLDNPVASADLFAQTVDSTDDPELISVGNPMGLGTATATVDFVFDEGGLTIPAATSAAGDYTLINADGTVTAAAMGAVVATAQTNVAGDTARVTFPNLTQAQYDAVRRAFVIAAEVDAGQDTVSVDVAGDGATNGPDLVDYTIDRVNDRVDVTFDTTVNGAGGAGDLLLITEAGTVIPSNAAPAAIAGDSDTVRVAFADLAAATVAEEIIYVVALDGLVNAPATNLDNRVDTITNAFAFAAGDTNGPNLESAALTVVGGVFPQTTITLTFDDVVETPPTAGNFDGFAANGQVVTLTPTGGITVVQEGGQNTNQVELTFDVGDAGKTQLEAGEVVLFALNDASVTDDAFGDIGYITSVPLS